MLQEFGVNPAVTATANTGLYTNNGAASGGTWSPEHAGGFSITQHHWLQVFDESNPGIRPGSGVDRATYLAAFNNAVRALTAQLPTCPAESLTDKGGSCYFGRFTPLTSWNSRPEEVGLLPPGVFALYAVPFGVHEMKDGRFTKTLVPSPQQRRELEWMVIIASQKRLFGSHGTRFQNRPLFGEALIDSCIKKAIGQTAYGVSTGVPGFADKYKKGLSVDDVLSVCPDVMLFSINLTRNSLQPTPAERTGVNGWYNWIARGGYPLSRAIVTGQAPVSDPVGIQFCNGLLCSCPAAVALCDGCTPMTSFPSCVPAGLNKDGPGEARVGEGAFYPYIAIPQDAVKPDIQISLVHDDPSWIERFGNAAAGFMNKLFGFMCANQDYSKAYLESLNKPTYINAAGQPCTKDSPGCIEKAPSPTSTASTGIVNAYMSAVCATWNKSNLPDPLLSLPPVAPIPVPPLPTTAPGTIFTFSAKRGGVYRVAVPKTPAASSNYGLGDAATAIAKSDVGVAIGILAGISAVIFVPAYLHYRRRGTLGTADECALPVYWLGPSNRRKYGVKIGGLTKIATEYKTHSGQVIDYDESSVTVKTPGGSQYKGKEIAVSCEPWMAKYERIRRL